MKWWQVAAGAWCGFLIGFFAAALLSADPER